MESSARHHRILISASVAGYWTLKYVNSRFGLGQ